MNGKKKRIELCFVELRDDLIVLKITNFNKYVAWQMKLPSTIKLEQVKVKGA